MRTLVDIPEHQLASLASLCAAEKVSRAELIRRALAEYLEKNLAEPSDAFGIWKHQAIDGLAYQERLRSEW